MWRVLAWLSVLVLVCAGVVSLISDDDWARITSFILTALGLIFGGSAFYLQRNVTWGGGSGGGI